MWGSTEHHTRQIVPLPGSRKKCPCCGNKVTHKGTANKLAMMEGCELRVRRWVRDGLNSYT